MASDSSKKLSARLAELIRRLYAGEQLQREALIAEFRVSERTIFRDLERLEDWIETTDDYRYQLKPHLRKQLQPKHLNSLFELLDMQELFPGNMLMRLTQQVEAPDEESSYLFRGPVSEMENVDRNDVARLDKAVQKRLVCHLRYRDKSRTLEPYRLVNQQGIWYLAAAEAGQLKAFALSQCSHVLVGDTAFVPKPELVQEIEHSDGIWFGPTTTVTLHVSGLAMDYFRRRQQLPHQRIVREQSNHLVVTTEVRHPEQLLPTLRYWIPHVRIVDHPDYAQALQNSLQQYLQALENQPIDAALS